MKKMLKIAAIAVSMMVASPALAEVCDYKPSAVVGPKISAVVQGASGAISATGAALKGVAGTYTATNFTTGAAMVGSTLPGKSAAGTVGFIAGSGWYAAPIAVITSTPVIIGAAVVGVGIAAYEGACWIAEK